MKEIKEHLRGELKIDSDTIILGMISGNVTVENSAILEIHGTINGNINIGADTLVIIQGRVSGNIVNKGTCEIYGSITGELIKEGGEFMIDEKAIINKS